MQIHKNNENIQTTKRTEVKRVCCLNVSSQFLLNCLFLRQRFISFLCFYYFFVLAATLQELDESFHSSLSVEIHNFIGFLLEELNGRKSLNVNVHQFIGCGVDLGDNDALVLLILLAEFIPDRSKFFAVSAPGSVELHEHILLLVQGHRGEVLPDQILDAFVSPVLGKILRLPVRSEIAREEFLHELPHVVHLNGAVLRLVLDRVSHGHIVRQDDGTERRKVGLLQSEEIQHPLVVLHVCIDRHEQQSSFVLLGDLLGHVHPVLVALSGGGHEEKKMRLHHTGEDLLGGLRVELHDRGKRLELHESGDIRLRGDVRNARHCFSSINLLDDNNRVAFHLVLISNFIITGDSELVIIHFDGGVLESFSSSVCIVFEEPDNGDI